ncbi:ABC transporter permease [Candidatus Clostridium stratigraminis]|uniref:ABC transporter permease n=1 Tax=Candidatus Clostridium stratigraminis TaxID=3381661 RepID=A0ABW8T2K3_9CLOT
MTIFASNLKRIFKKKVNRLIIFLAPILFIILAFNLITPGKINIAVVDKDNTEFSNAFIKGLKEKGNVGVIPEADIKTGIINKTIDYGIIIDKGFTDSIIKGEDVKIETLRAEGANVTSVVKLYVENYINAAKNISKNAKGDKNEFYSSLKDYEKGAFKSENIIFGSALGDGKKERSALGMLGYMMLLIATFSTNMILEDKKNNTYTRMFASPLKNWSYMLQNILSILLVVLIQVYIAFKFMTAVFKAQLGASELNMFLIFTIYAVSCVALSLAIVSISKNIKQASVLGLLINTLVGMLGGFFWPKEYMPNTMITIGKFTPSYWLTDGVDKLLTSPSIASAAQDIGIILLFTIAFFMASSWKKVYIENI